MTTLPPAQAGVWFSRAELDIKVGEAIDKYVHAIELIAGALLDEATNREWCDEYDEFARNVNSQLPDDVPKLFLMPSTFEITFEIKGYRNDLVGLEEKIDEALLAKGLPACTDFDWKEL